MGTFSSAAATLCNPALPRVLLAELGAPSTATVIRLVENHLALKAKRNWATTRAAEFLRYHASHQPVEVPRMLLGQAT